MKNNPRDLYYQRTYPGFSLAKWDLMFKMQFGKCKICKSKREYRLHVDHDHKTGRVRGLLCIRCNKRLLGRGLEIPALHRAAAEYLESDFDGRAL